MNHLASKRYSEDQRFVHLHTYIHSNRKQQTFLLLRWTLIGVHCGAAHIVGTIITQKQRILYLTSLHFSKLLYTMYMSYKKEHYFVFKENSNFNFFLSNCRFLSFWKHPCHLWTWSLGLLIKWTSEGNISLATCSGTLKFWSP